MTQRSKDRTGPVRPSKSSETRPVPAAPGSVVRASSLEATHRSGVVAILGRPNAGKSTLLNALLGTKIAIVASKPQTTRTSIQGVLTRPDVQIAFIDTPGIHRSTTLLNKRMMDEVRSAADSPDVVLFLVDALAPFSNEDAQAVDLVKKAGVPALAIFNKVDQLKDKSRLLALIERYRDLHDFAEYIPISALTALRKQSRGRPEVPSPAKRKARPPAILDGLETLRDEIIKRLPEGPALYPANYLTDQPERFLAAETLREKILQVTRQEVPHAVAVMIEKWEETPALLRISATIFVERTGQKAILIGAGGAALKKVGTLARKDLEASLGRKVFLETFVKVRPNWRQDPEFLAAVDWRSMAGM